MVICIFLWNKRIFCQKKLSSSFCHALAYLPWKYQRNRIFDPCREIKNLSDFYRQALLSFQKIYRLMWFSFKAPALERDFQTLSIHLSWYLKAYFMSFVRPPCCSAFAIDNCWKLSWECLVERKATGVSLFLFKLQTQIVHGLFFSI